MNVDPPASLVICGTLKCCDDGRSQRSAGPKASCQVGPIFPRGIGPTERGSLRHVSAGYRTGASGMQRNRNIRVRRPQTHILGIPQHDLRSSRRRRRVGSPERRNMGPTQRCDDVTSERRTGFPHLVANQTQVRPPPFAICLQVRSSARRFRSAPPVRVRPSC
jgi:hypothetical protein